jgi:hypothetical protein
MRTKWAIRRVPRGPTTWLKWRIPAIPSVANLLADVAAFRCHYELKTVTFSRHRDRYANGLLQLHTDARRWFGSFNLSSDIAGISIPDGYISAAEKGGT